MLGERLKTLRESKGLTQAELSKLISIPRGTYAHYELGKREPDNETLLKFAEIYSVETDYLLGRIQSPSRNISDIVLRAFREVVIPHVREETIKQFGPDAPSVKLCDEIDSFSIEQQKGFFNELVKRFYFDENGVIQFELHEPSDEEAAASIAELTDEQMTRLVQSLSRDGRRKLLKIIANTDD